MKKLFLVATVGFLSLHLASCLTPQVNLTVSQGLLVGEAAVDGANHGASVAVAAGLHGPAAHTVHVGIDAANNAIGSAKALYRNHDLGGAAAQLNTALKTIADVRAQTNAATPGVSPSVDEAPR